MTVDEKDLRRLLLLAEAAKRFIVKSGSNATIIIGPNEFESEELVEKLHMAIEKFFTIENAAFAAQMLTQFNVIETVD